MTEGTGSGEREEMTEGRKGCIGEGGGLMEKRRCLLIRRGEEDLSEVSHG